MKFKSSSPSRWIYFIQCAISIIFIYVFWSQYFFDQLNFYTFGVIFLFFIGLVIILFYRRNMLSLPSYEVKNNLLIIHYGGGEFDKFPLSKFNGKINVETHFFEKYIIAPNYHRYNGKIPIGFIDRSKQKRLIQLLKIST